MAKGYTKGKGGGSGGGRALNSVDKIRSALGSDNAEMRRRAETQIDVLFSNAQVVAARFYRTASRADRKKINEAKELLGGVISAFESPGAFRQQRLDYVLRIQEIIAAAR